MKSFLSWLNEVCVPGKQIESKQWHWVSNKDRFYAVLSTIWIKHLQGEGSWNLLTFIIAVFQVTTIIIAVFAVNTIGSKRRNVFCKINRLLRVLAYESQDEIRLLVVCLFSFGPTSMVSKGKRTHNCVIDKKGLGSAKECTHSCPNFFSY